ncbi:hypothetical protein E8E13_001118 [Curvularia kusanoi]|uniref:Large ribosomal subunit protein bL12 C-terminal domain-containing protein n=1 Tax=Curvularia kusanoi TaxID=90978 RepID=A0A9P4T628_CURKU|nr:hypothetical protein E8E13_001118 [Curvularia kusanoi]
MKFAETAHFWDMIMCCNGTIAALQDKVAPGNEETQHGIVVDYMLAQFALVFAGQIANDSLQTRLNIPDMPMGGFVAAGGAGPAAAAPAAEEEEAAPAAAEKTLFNLKLEKFDAGSKPKVIKEIKSMLGLSLVDSKKFVESAPKMMKEGVPKEEAEKIVETLKALGATAIME